MMDILPDPFMHLQVNANFYGFLKKDFIFESCLHPAWDSNSQPRDEESQLTNWASWAPLILGLKKILHPVLQLAFCK